ncbi:MAG: cob(I)yrinic acid a,c-diamide adenosyltransferase [Patescibacteria group bacterium]
MKPPAVDAEGNGQQGFGLIQLFTGDGKGKTSVAIGTIVRAIGKGKRVALVAFDKGGEHYAERLTFRDLLPSVEVFPTGLDRMDFVTGKFRFGVTEEDKAEGERGLAIVGRLFEEARHDVIVLDEINISTTLGIIHEEDVLALLDQKPATCELILTGRDAPQTFLDRADLVTELRMVKHYFYKGVKPREGLDY